ncbi:conserved hypothetical protein [Candidatus Desulfosporosinus infrequens]|uniref:Uncharacterized protein n=1 Tax=Candidatus Desulfosporosinus infrequens TaxID=2043169 RepID=A0A2U3LS56_9FIRM|nr:conserved hypothetical protein [Candidatus Desulfosporosinus infrequens]
MIDLQVHQKFAKLGLKITPFQFDMTTSPANLTIQQPPATMVINQPAATLEIDRSSVLETIGYCSIAAQQQTFNQNALETSNAGIDRIVRQGYQLGDISKKISVAKIVTQHLEPKAKMLELVSVPAIKVSVQDNPVTIQVSVNNVQTNTSLGNVQVQFQAGSVQAYFEQEPSILIQAVGSLVDTES